MKKYFIIVDEENQKIIINNNTKHKIHIMQCQGKKDNKFHWNTYNTTYFNFKIVTSFCFDTDIDILSENFSPFIYIYDFHMFCLRLKKFFL